MWKVEKIVSKGDYDYAKVNGHPNATKNGYVLLHRIVMENHLGRLLNGDEIVHHVNNDKKDNSIENLVVMSNSEHAKMHGKERGSKWLDLKCPQCDKVFSRKKRDVSAQKSRNKYGFVFCSLSCGCRFVHALRRGPTHKMNKAISENIVREYIVYPHDNSEETN